MSLKGLENAIRNLNSLDSRMVPQASAWAVNRVAASAVSAATHRVAKEVVAGDNQKKGIPFRLVKQRVSATVAVGATTSLTFTVKPDNASDKTLQVATADPLIATVTLKDNVATVKGVKAGSVNIVGISSNGSLVAVAAVTVTAS